MRYQTKAYNYKNYTEKLFNIQTKADSNYFIPDRTQINTTTPVSHDEPPSATLQTYIFLFIPSVKSVFSYTPVYS